MGSPISPVVAVLSIQLLFYYRYVDDVVLVAPSDTMNDIKNIFNSLHARLQFIIEIGTQSSLNFLDTIIIIENNRIMFNRFQKSTCSGRFLNFHSHYPLCHKRRRDVITCSIDRILLLSHPKFHERNLIDAVHTFLENGYPLYFIFATVNNRLLFYIHKYKNSHISYFPKKEIAANKYFTILYVKSVSETGRRSCVETSFPTGLVASRIKRQSLLYDGFTKLQSKVVEPPAESRKNEEKGETFVEYCCD
ncbi:hypothetical protein ALC56_06090 [Trachymyrmex septentrionalis]|uniref:Helix-turn-helix domain-containing protein n=1 Tax=Trachymyrmex septentrionalis TaxID=34720 RepID=A0A195FGU4_9HYME|nr:hypothetical protein ALC56_06090 [Trachymyrmex septentrionalis]